MPNRKVVLLSRGAGQEDIPIAAMREAVNVGIADIEAGRYTEFETTEALRQGLTSIVREALGSKPPAEGET